MATASLKVTGDEELQRLLRKISPRQNPEWVTAAMKRSATLVRHEIRLNIVGPRPRHLDVVSGQLMSSIKNVKEDYPFQVRIGTKIRWAGKYEFGPIRDRRPFLSPAEQATHKPILNIFADVAGRIVAHG